MTEYTKRYVNLWLKTDKNGKPMLSGRDKTDETYYYVFTDKENDAKKRVAKSEKGKDIVTLGDLEEGSSDYGTYWKYNQFFIAENRFYDENDPFIKTRSGEYVLNKEGEKISQPEFTLSISERTED